MAIKKFKVNASKQAKSIKSTKKSVKASSSLKVKPYVINKGQSGEYYGLKNAEDNQVLHSAPNNWKSERGAINWAKKKGYDVVDSACGKKSVKASYDDGFADMLHSVRYHLRFNKGADLIFDNRTISSNKRDIGHLLDKYNVDDVIVDVDRDRAGKRDLQRMHDLGFEIQNEFLGETPSNPELPPHDVYHMVRNKKSVKSSKSVKKFGIKASKAAKKRKAIKASGIQDDIVMYFNGDNVYQGSVYDLADAVENLCYDDEVNAKFQEWCNQFGDPFDFDGSPIDTARVFTDIIIHEAEESPVSEDGQSEFYEDGDGILDFEIFYADEYSIDGAKSIKCSSSDNYNDLDEAMRFRVCNYYDTKFRDLAECKVFDDFDEAVDYAHECLGKGPTTIEDYYVGTVEIDPDEYWDNFDGEFWCTPELANFRDEVWKSMGIGASKSIKCGMSLNLNANPNYTDWVLRGYKFDGEDVTTLRIDFQDDVKEAVMDMFSDPDIETVDLYKIPTEQETTGVFEDEEYFSTITRDDINASTDITAALNKKSDINDEQYNQALADEVADMLRADGFEDIEVSVAPEAISFFINDEVMFVQPTNMITPNMADIYDDCTELFNAVKEATTDKMWKLYDEENEAMRDAWGDPDINDSDYATRAVTLSRKAKGKDISAAEETIDIDDLDYISGDDEQEDWGYGFDSNGEPVTESMVEELERIAQEILDKSEIHNIDKYADLHNFNYYASIPYIQESFDISFTYVADIYELSKNGMATDEGIYTTVAPYNVHFNVRCENGEVKYAECTDVDVNDGYVKDVELTNFNLDALVQFATDLVNPAAMDIYNATTNI